MPGIIDSREWRRVVFVFNEDRYRYFNEFENDTTVTERLNEAIRLIQAGNPPDWVDAWLQSHTL